MLRNLELLVIIYIFEELSPHLSILKKIIDIEKNDSSPMEYGVEVDFIGRVPDCWRLNPDIWRRKSWNSWSLDSCRFN